MATLEGVSLEEMESLALLSKTLADNPATRKDFLGLIKMASPMTNIPELDMETRFSAQTKPLLEKIASLESQANQRNFNELRKESHGKLIKMGISEEEIPDVEKLMLEKKIGDFTTAGEFFIGQKASAAPTSGNFKHATQMTMPDMKAMGADGGKAWALNQAHNVVDELMKLRH